MTAFAWVLEKGDVAKPQYACIEYGVFGWTEPGDHSKAFRMARREDADALAEIVEDTDRVAEHGWG